MKQRLDYLPKYDLLTTKIQDDTYSSFWDSLGLSQLCDDGDEREVFAWFLTGAIWLKTEFVHMVNECVT